MALGTAYHFKDSRPSNMYSKKYVNSPLPTRIRPTSWWRLLIDYIRLAIRHINLCIKIKREREFLTKLTDSQLLDINVRRDDADAESQRSFFDVPADRLGLHTETHKNKKSEYRAIR